MCIEHVIIHLITDTDCTFTRTTPSSSGAEVAASATRVDGDAAVMVTRPLGSVLMTVSISLSVKPRKSFPLIDSSVSFTLLDESSYNSTYECTCTYFRVPSFTSGLRDAMAFTTTISVSFLAAVSPKLKRPFVTSTVKVSGSLDRENGGEGGGVVGGGG